MVTVYSDLLTTQAVYIFTNVPKQFISKRIIFTTISEANIICVKIVHHCKKILAAISPNFKLFAP